jgi:hypothetical protein
MAKLQPNETDLIGEWKVVGGKVVGNEACERIDLLTSQYLEHIAVGNWEKLYRDPEDGRYWELTYPHSDWHGGGPPRLTCLSEEEAQTKYGVG